MSLGPWTAPSFVADRSYDMIPHRRRADKLRAAGSGECRHTRRSGAASGSALPPLARLRLPREKVCFACQVDTSVRESRVVVGAPHANPLLRPLDDAKLPKRAEEQRGLLVALTMTLPNGLPRRSAPISGFSRERIHCAAHDRCVHDRAPLRIGGMYERVE